MSKDAFRTTPELSDKLPPGIPYIVGNEAAERFSFYGMKAILFVFMTQYLMKAGGGERDVMTPAQANEWVHLFVTSAYFFPIIGALFSDLFLGKYRTILWISIIYCLGHLCLAIDDTRFWLMSGLTLIAIGTGAIKPCVSAHVGDQFGTKNQHLISRVFGWFYFAINLGATASTLLTPFLLKMFGPSVAFGVPGVLMALATFVFWLGRHKFIHVPPGGMGAVREAFSGKGGRAILNLVPVYLCVAMFWALFDQTASSWVHQARRMDRQWLGIDWLPSQVQAANPILVMLFIPIFSYILYPLLDKVFPLTPLRKIGIGFFVTVLAFAMPAWIESRIEGGQVVKATSEGDGNNFPAERILDGDTAGHGWVSSRWDDQTKPQEIVIQLREREAWKISSIRFHPASDLSDFFVAQRVKEEQAKLGLTDFLSDKVRRIFRHVDDSRFAPPPEDMQRSWAKDVEVFIGDSPLGDAQPAAGEEAASYAWTRSVGSLELTPEARFQSLSFAPVETEYVMVRVLSNFGGDYVALGEVEAIADEPLLADATPGQRDVWPNVAATGFRPNIVWQLLSYVLMTAAEIMISITCLEFSYTQAPNKIKSFIMSLFLLSVSAGNFVTAAVNHVIQNPDETTILEGADYYWFFTVLILVTAFVYLLVAKLYRGQTYIQGTEEVAVDSA